MQKKKSMFTFKCLCFRAHPCEKIHSSFAVQHDTDHRTGQQKASPKPLPLKKTSSDTTTPPNAPTTGGVKEEFGF